MKVFCLHGPAKVKQLEKKVIICGKCVGKNVHNEEQT